MLHQLRMNYRVPKKKGGEQIMEKSKYKSGEIPRRPLGRTGVEVSALALGGYSLGLVKPQREAIRIAQEAFDAGITFMDNAWEYHDGLSEEIMGKALVGHRQGVFLMYKTAKSFDGPAGRKLHGFPPMDELAA
jgi:aryl-alcohol dehydrogenase-like predicted oxidoreductase